MVVNRRHGLASGRGLPEELIDALVVAPRAAGRFLKGLRNIEILNQLSDAAAEFVNELSDARVLAHTDGMGKPLVRASIPTSQLRLQDFGHASQSSTTGTHDLNVLQVVSGLQCR